MNSSYFYVIMNLQTRGVRDIIKDKKVSFLHASVWVKVV